MNLRLSPSEAKFVEDLRHWLNGVEIPTGLRDFGSTPLPEDLPAARVWQQILFDAGFAGMSWSRDVGGRGGTLAEQALFAEELGRRGLPKQLGFVTMELAGPVIAAYGTPEQQQRFLEPMLRGEELWCQLFSEPDAGSDLGSLRTRATPDGDGWVIDGQKIWTSGAQYSDFGLLMARTEAGSTSHRGITCFLLPMKRDGIEVRPTRQMDGYAKFNEVFLDSVPVHADEVLGNVGEGWSIALSILGTERKMLGATAIGLFAQLSELRDTAVAGSRDDMRFRQCWSELWARVALFRWTWLRLLSESSGTDMSDPRTSILKLASSRLQQDVAGLAADMLGNAFLSGEAGAIWRGRFLASHGSSIAGGTSEIQRQILADRVLKLPKTKL